MGYRSWAWCHGAGSSQPCHSLPGAAAECAIGHKLQETPASHSELLKVGGSSLSWKQGLGTGTFTCWLHKATMLSCALSTAQARAVLSSSFQFCLERKGGCYCSMALTPIWQEGCRHSACIQHLDECSHILHNTE